MPARREHRHLGNGGRRRNRSAGPTSGAGALLVIARRAAGIPASLLRPARWGALAHHIHGGFGSISTTLWPYSGRDAWTRTDILLGLVVAPFGAAVLAFWPPASPSRAAA